MKSDDVDTKWIVEVKKEQATGVNICLLSLDYKMLFYFFILIYNCINIDVHNISKNAERMGFKMEK